MRTAPARVSSLCVSLGNMLSTSLVRHGVAGGIRLLRAVGYCCCRTNLVDHPARGQTIEKHRSTFCIGMIRSERIYNMISYRSCNSKVNPKHYVADPKATGEKICVARSGLLMQRICRYGASSPKQLISCPTRLTAKSWRDHPMRELRLSYHRRGEEECKSVFCFSK